MKDFINNRLVGAIITVLIVLGGLWVIFVNAQHGILCTEITGLKITEIDNIQKINGTLYTCDF